MAQLTLTDPARWAGKLIQVCDYSPTGQQLIDAFTAVHNGQAPTVYQYTDQDIADKANESDFGALEAMLIRHCESLVALRYAFYVQTDYRECDH